jgi:hypothetical protein
MPEMRNVELIEEKPYFQQNKFPSSFHASAHEPPHSHLLFYRDNYGSKWPPDFFIS